MHFSKAILAVLAASGVSSSPVEKRQFAYGSTPVRGVNIGGWLVLEPWITPSLFNPYGTAVIDEFSLSSRPNAASILKSHWDSFCTLADFQKIAANGFNQVRIPIGYWAYQKYPGDPYISGQDAYLERAIGWARQTRLKVVIDLHGAPLSQNGFDNSGQRTNTPQWTSGNTIPFTVSIINSIAQKYGGSSYADVVVGINLLNEPLMPVLPGGRGATQSYYQQGFDTVRKYGQTPVVIGDGFASPSSWNGFLTGQGSNGAIIDHHEYQVFTNELVALTPEQHAGSVAGNAQSFSSGRDKYLIVGEWTAAMTDCAPGLNGWGIGARYDGTFSRQTSTGYESSRYVGSCARINFIDQWSDYNRTTTRNYISAQIRAFEQYTQGWEFWNFKTEAAAEWDLFRLIDNGIWPGF